MLRAIAFDAFGTLVHLNPPRHPYGQVLRDLRATDEERAVARAWALTQTSDLNRLARFVGRPGSAQVLAQAGLDLERELNEVALYPDVPAAWAWVKAFGLQRAVASNLATPYAAPVMRLLPDAPDVQGWSFAWGAMKPQAGFFSRLCRELDVAPSEVLMVGDTLAHDVYGAQQAGLNAVWLNRMGRPVPEGVAAIRSLHELPSFVAKFSRE